MSNETFASLQLGIVVNLEDVNRVLSHKPYQPRTEVADVVLNGKVVGKTNVPVHDESTQQSWTVHEQVYSEFDDALDAFCGPLKLSWGYVPYNGEIPCVWFAPYHKANSTDISFKEVVRAAKGMPRVRKIVKKVFGLKELSEGVFAALARD